MTQRWELSRAPVGSRLRVRTERLLERLGPRPLSARTGGRVVGAVESLRAWVAENPGASYEVMRPAESYLRRPPNSLTPEGQARLRQLRRQESPEAFRALIPGARLMDPSAPLVLTADRRLVLESAFEHRRTTPTPQRRLHRPRHLEGRYMALLNEWWKNHFHWTLDTLPRASLLPFATEPQTRIIVPADLTDAQVDSLALIGIPRDRLIPFDHPHLQVEELVFPSFVGQPGFPPPWAVSWLRERLSLSAQTPRRRLWVSRAGAIRGRVANEQAVLKLLDRYQIEPIQPERHSCAEQLRMFGAADVIIAPHGSGLANIVAARDATVIELQSERWWGNGCYYTLSDALDLDYWFMLCDTTRSGHLLVDLEVLRATIDAALGGAQPGTA